MSKKQIFTFLRDLTANNSKEWMDANRKQYQLAKNTWLAEIDLILKRLAVHNPTLEQIKPKETIMRINNNRRFQPDKPLYKDNFGCSIGMGMSNPGFYIHLSPSGSFVGGGIYRPEKEVLQKIREAIDYDGARLRQLASTPPLTDFYGGLDEDDQALKTAPRDFPKDHPEIDLLRRKNFTAIRALSEKEIISDDFPELMEKAYLSLQPLCNYLTQAVNFEE
jgi:uncharacterized protein (TIGR02453 family)